MSFDTPFGVRIVRFPLACWSASMASKRDLKFPAPKPCAKKTTTIFKVSSEQKTISTDVIILTHRLMCCKSCEWRPHLVVMSLNDLQEHSGAILNWLGEDLK